MNVRTLLAPVLGGAIAATIGCTIPFSTPDQTISVPYDKFIPNAVNGVPIPLIPAFNDIAAPSVSIPVPAEAKKAKLESIVLGLKLKNSGQLPIRMALYLGKAGDDVYGKPPLGDPNGTIELGATGTVEKSFPLDPALLQGDQLTLGYKFGSPGSSTPVTIKDSDKVEVTYKMSVVAKLI